MSSANCEGLSVMEPSRIGGHVKPRFSNRLEYRHRPVPSHAKILIRSARFDRKTKNDPLKGLSRRVSLTNTARESMPRRKSTGCVATRMRSPVPSAITARSEQPIEPCAGRPRPHRRGHGCAPRGPQSRWTTIAAGSATPPLISRPARKPASKRRGPSWWKPSRLAAT